ncbi:MAG: hypothetical protein B7Z66_06635 [Chromatiales bacterium 21-64-14]|nr:MAG: hypothetical protein B7Z66_06635 [Chromatiales bacterium 21-64-14]HQU16543.1 succinate dehydrogenase assembly factor 2 [Gammaproteobacteria bacterium]
MTAHLYATESARLRWSCRRGMRELDLLLLGFLEHGYQAQPAPMQGAFQRLLRYPDPVLLEWLLGRGEPREPELAHVIAEIRRTAAA